LYFENKINDFHFEVLAQTYKADPGIVDLLQSEKDAVFNARDIILTDLKQHFTIRQISEQVQLNEFKLKAGFKQLFGTGMFECLLRARMEKAKKLLIETDKPMKEIASLTGYEFLTSFITAFRKYFDYTPGSLRRK
jgi:AraC family transcriptional activator of pyochelin receptor